MQTLIFLFLFFTGTILANQVGDWTDEPSLDKLVNFGFNLSCKFRPSASLRLLYGPLAMSDGQFVDCDLRIKTRHLKLCPSKDVTILLKEGYVPSCFVFRKGCAYKGWSRVFVRPQIHFPKFIYGSLTTFFELRRGWSHFFLFRRRSLSFLRMRSLLQRRPYLLWTGLRHQRGSDSPVP